MISKVIAIIPIKAISHHLTNPSPKAFIAIVTLMTVRPPGGSSIVQNLALEAFDFDELRGRLRRELAQLQSTAPHTRNLVKWLHVKLHAAPLGQGCALSYPRPSALRVVPLVYPSFVFSFCLGKWREN